MSTKNVPIRDQETASQVGGWRRVFEEYFAVVLVCVISLATLTVAYTQVFHSTQRRRAVEFQRRVVDIRDNIQNRFDHYTLGLDFGHSFVMSSEYVSRSEWAMFYEAQNVDAHFPGVMGYGFVEYVEADRVDEFVGLMREDGALDYTVKVHPGFEGGDESGPKYLIKYHEPAARNRGAWGLDVAARPANKEVYDLARDTGMLSVSDPIQLFQSDEPEWGLVFAMPVYRKGAEVSTIEHRRGAIVGWVVTSIGLDQFFKAEWADRWDGFDIEINYSAHGDGASGSIIYQSGLVGEKSLADSGSGRMVTQIPLDVENISLALSVAPESGDRVWLVSGLGGVILIGGLLVTALLTMITWSLTRTRSKAILMARSMTKTIRESEHHQRALALQADSANKSKTEFLANMSHEIRTPMTAILGYGEILEENISSDMNSACCEAIVAIQRSGKHLMTVINAVLDLSKIESGKLSVDREMCSVLETVQGVEQALRIGASRKGLIFGVEFATAIPAQVRTDAYRIRQVLINLIGNAIKFTSAGSVKIVLYADKERILFSIVDTGEGILDSEVSKLFSPFEQIDPSNMHKHDGTGLGLVISKRLAYLLGGDLTVESRSGMGSTFTLSIPLDCPEGVEMVDVLPAIVKARSSASDEGVSSGIEQMSGRVLLVEDGIDTQMLISRVLRRAGLEVEVVGDGQAAVDLLSKPHGFDLVLMDMQMPVKDGYVATRELRGMGLDLPIIALTAHALDGARQNCLDAGCDEYATKPINRDRLYRLIRELLDRDGSGRAAA